MSNYKPKFKNIMCSKLRRNKNEKKKNKKVFLFQKVYMTIVKNILSLKDI